MLYVLYTNFYYRGIFYHITRYLCFNTDDAYCVITDARDFNIDRDLSTLKITVYSESDTYHIKYNGCLHHTSALIDVVYNIYRIQSSLDALDALCKKK